MLRKVKYLVIDTGKRVCMIDQEINALKKIERFERCGDVEMWRSVLMPSPSRGGVLLFLFFPPYCTEKTKWVWVGGGKDNYSHGKAGLIPKLT